MSHDNTTNLLDTLDPDWVRDELRDPDALVAHDLDADDARVLIALDDDTITSAMSANATHEDEQRALQDIAENERPVDDETLQLFSQVVSNTVIDLVRDHLEAA